MNTADLTPIPLTLIETDLPAAAAAFGAAFTRTGFAVVSEHGIPEATFRRARGAAKALFALSPRAKSAYAHPCGQRGYTPFAKEIAKAAATPDLKEFWHIGRELPDTHPDAANMDPNIWPWEWPDFRPATLALYEALDIAGQRLLRALAVHLGQNADFFDAATKDGNSILRLLHYPPLQNAPKDALRAAAHEDINVITLLPPTQEAGLELRNRNGDWQRIKAPADCLIVNIGDMLARLSGGLLPSTTHRVTNPDTNAGQGRARYSMPFFLHFRSDYLITPIAGGPDAPSPITADTFLRQRLQEIGLL